ncbi:hypothetical protein [Gluconobacter oxydans]|nr:hypothetical protein [Gluconobacter oxydans]
MTQAKNSAVRTREEQVKLFGDMVEELGSVGDNSYGWVRREIEAAEARGAAQQRRKDAEGQEPVAWVDAEDLPSEECQRRPCHLILKRTPIYSTPLYTSPANIAALEARVKELEAEKVARDKAREHNWFYLREDPECSHSDVSGLLDDLCPLEMVQIAEAADVRTFWAFQRAHGEIFEFDTEEEALAALTREGEQA